MKFIFGFIILAIIFVIIVRLSEVQTIFVDVYPVYTYKEAQTIQKDFSNFDVEFLSWGMKTLQLKVRAKSIDTLVSYISANYHVTTRIGNNQVTISTEKKNEN